jgi:hypothetical protein
LNNDVGRHGHRKDPAVLKQPPATLPRRSRALVKNTMFLRPRRPDDHRQLEALLPQLTPLFVYPDGHGQDIVRWAMPRAVAKANGWDDMHCACCDDDTVEGDKNFVHVDVMWKFIDWFFEADDQ